ncbi:hypothetical protein [Streptomyces sp. NPDC005898]|uniref:hypothetical protein n=1 Tax=Streptomyces sp. NPDC005898 TaxID=3157082 RepID=UPI0033C67685
MGRRLGGGRGAALAVGAALCVTGVLPPAQTVAAGASSPYGFAEDAETIDGATSNAAGHRLSPGKSYLSSLPRAGQRFYRLELTAEESAYVAVTAVPGVAEKVSYADGLKVSVQDADGANCSPREARKARFGASESPRPVTATAARRVGPDERSCAGAGTYYVLVERMSDPESSRRDWGLELRVATEPALRSAGATRAPRSWNSATPAPRTGERKSRAGGPGFSGARALGTGVWGDRIAPGRTLFYRVPVDWGQRLSVGAELGSSSGRGERNGAVRGSGRGKGYVSSALVVALSNPVRAEVEDEDTAYDGKQKSVRLDPLPPVAYENRFAPADRVAAVRFAGWYYLSVHLSPRVAEVSGEGPLDLTLRISVEGAARPGPAYAGSPIPAGEFGVTEGDDDDDTAMVVLAVGGIGTGAGLLGVLGVWTLVARRRATLFAVRAGSGPTRRR